MSISKDMWMDALKDIVDKVMSGDKARGKLPDILLRTWSIALAWMTKSPIREPDEVFISRIVTITMLGMKIVRCGMRW